VTERQISDDESEFHKAMGLILEKTKSTLGRLLIDGIYLVSERHRQEPFKYLGQWLLIQADIRDENSISQITN